MRIELLQFILIFLISLPYLNSENNGFVPQVLDSDEDGSRYVILIEIENKKEKIEISRTIQPISHTKLTIGKSEAQYVPIPKYYYDGVVVGKSGSKVYVKYNKTLDGLIFYLGNTYIIKPENSENEHSDIHLIRLAEVKEPHSFGFGTDNSEEPMLETKLIFPSEMIETERNVRGFESPLFTGTYYLKVSVLIPYSLYSSSLYGKNNPSLFSKHMFDLFHQAKYHYSFVDIVPVCMNIDIWTDERDFPTVRAGMDFESILEEVRLYRFRTLYPRGDAYDQTTLFTDFPFGPYSGVATLGSLCTPLMSAALARIGENGNVYGAIFSREAAHSIGITVDTAECVCPSFKACLMGSGLSFGNHHEGYGFSNCSHELFKQVKANPNTCLRIPPPPNPFNGNCGDGIVSGNEECDCGSEQRCRELKRDKLCNYATCRLFDGVECDSGVCCDANGKFTKGNVCRKGDGFCIRDVQCEGKMSGCPADIVYEPLGTSCGNRTGFCVTGECRTRDNECKIMWGPGASLGPSHCNNYNGYGVYYGNCGTSPRGNGYDWVPCHELDTWCGKLWCYIPDSFNRPNLRGFEWDEGCGYGEYTGRKYPEFGLVRDFVPCDDKGERACYQHYCIPIEDALRVHSGLSLSNLELGDRTRRRGRSDENEDSGISIVTQNENKRSIILISVLCTGGILAFIVLTVIFALKRNPSAFKRINVEEN